MASTKSLNFEKAIEYMDPMQVTDYLHKILDFLQRNNNELYFPSISPYVEAFLVSLVTDTRNLTSKLFKYEDRKLASDIIQILEMSRDVFRWSHSYENGNLLVYKKIFSNKIKKKPAKPSSIAHRLLQAQTTQQSTPSTHHASSHGLTSRQRALEAISLQPDIPLTTTSFKLRFINKTLRFIKDEAESTLVYNEMPHDLAEYIYNLIKYRDTDVGFGYKSLYAPLWVAMEEYGVDYKFEVTIEKTSSSTAVLMLDKVPRSKSKRGKPTQKEEMLGSINTDENAPTPKKDVSKNTQTKQQQHSNIQNQSQNQPSDGPTSGLPPLELLSNISEGFFKETLIALTEFADDESRASVVLDGLSADQITFIKRVKTLAESSKVRNMFSLQYRFLLWRLHYGIKEVSETCRITTAVNEKHGSITLKKTPRFAAPLPVTQSVTTRARSKSTASSKTRERSISKDRLIQFEKGGKHPGTGDLEPSTDGVATGKDDQRERSRSKDGMNKRTAKLLEDLSTPVESDRGIRMMLLMGWDGGALGARGDGIMEPVMPTIELPTRGGLGHVPPPKPSPKPPKPPKTTPRQPLNFRLTFLHAMYDLLLHDDNHKELQFKEPLARKECRFIHSALGDLNKRRTLSLTAKEKELVGLVARELAGRPGLEVRHEISPDFRSFTLQKVTDQPVKAAKMSAPKPPDNNSSTAKNQFDVTTTDGDAVVLIALADVTRVMPHVDVTDINPANHKAIRKRALRLTFLTKFAEVLHSGCQTKILFKFDFHVPNKLKSFVRSIVDCLNTGDWHCVLHGWEAKVYEELRDMVRGSVLAVQLLSNSKFVFTRTPVVLTKKDSLNPGPGQRDNNNEEKTDNRNQIVHPNDCTKQVNIDKIDSKQDKLNAVENNVDNQRLIQAIVETTSYLKEDISNIELNNKDITCESNEKLDLKGTSNQAEGLADNSKNSTGDVDVKDINLINSNENEKTDKIEVKIETECDIAEPNGNKSNMTIKSEVNNNGMNESDADGLSDLERDIQDLEMTILKADLDCVLKEENDTDCDFDMTISETDLNIKEEIIKEKDIDYLNAKRSHSSSESSQDLNSKKVKISTETDEHIVILIPKNPDQRIREELIIEVQTSMANSIDKAGGFLPLLKCHGVQNGGLIYGCHDEDDVAWVKNVISTANLDVEVVRSNDLHLEKKSRELLIKINSCIPLDAENVFRKFELYNDGLNTKYWKVSYKYTDTEFIMFIVTVDEKSFKYISDERFSLYCGVDKAQFSVLFY